MSQSNDSGLNPYDEGLEEAHKGQMAAPCPYAFDSAEGAQWLDGFQDGGGDD